ncbi:MAG: hypothetical protein OEW67_09020 [Cyclobacteriaceae bacterium]|nr:hypothetical protein [Cyclobacteriaceae bacterium]
MVPIFYFSCDNVESELDLEIIPEIHTGSEINQGIYSYIFDVNDDGVIDDGVIDEQNEKESFEFGIENTVQWYSFNYAPTPPEPYISTGIWEREGDTLRIHYNNTLSYHFYNGFTYNDDSKTYLYLFPFLKISGYDSSVVGSYTSYYKVTSDYYTKPVKTTRYLNINEDYTWVEIKEIESPFISGVKIEEDSGVWSIEDIKEGNFQLINFQNRTFLKGFNSLIYTKE